jgi:S-formylglutathione hydrolase FrmB
MGGYGALLAAERHPERYHGSHTDGFWRATAHELLAFVTSR